MRATPTLDKAGRLVLPKLLREALRLRPGCRQRAEVEGDKTTLGLDDEEVQIVRATDGLPAVVGWDGFDAAAAIQTALEPREDTMLAYQNWKTSRTPTFQPGKALEIGRTD